VTEKRSDLWPTISVILAAAMWGLFWIPVRSVEAAGIDPVWSGILIFASGTVVLLPMVLVRWRIMLRHSKHFFWAGLFSGFTFALYTISINLTDVVRVLLLFYLTPLWSTLLGIVVLGERLTLNRVLALVLAATGLCIVLGIDYRFPLPENLGDWLALISGFTWSIASVKLFQGSADYVIEKAFLFVFFGFVFSVALALLPLGIESVQPSLELIADAKIPIAILAIMMLPLAFLTIWPCTLLSPARVGMLYMLDVVVGVVSAALLTDEVFGAREMIGTILILSAGVVEVMRSSAK
jgi:drug/metabolite transporter (DMT)-like permease